jgi:hypothetical protein
MKTSNLIHSLAVLTLAIVVGSWSLISLSSGVETQPELWNSEFEFGALQQFEKTTHLKQNGRDSIVFMPGTSASVSFDESQNHLDITLEFGTLLVSSLANDFSASVHMDSLQLNSEGSIAVVEASEDGSSIVTKAVTNPSLLVFLQEEQPLNVLSLPTNHRITVPTSKVKENLAKLRLTKLSKEFPAFVLKDGDFTEEVQKELDKLDLNYKGSTLRYLARINKDIDLGPDPTGFGSQVNGFWSGLKAALTLAPHAQEALDAVHADERLTYITSNLVQGDPAQAELWLQQWSSQPHTQEELETLFSDLFWVLPGDELYPLKEAAMDQLFVNREMVLLRNKYKDIERLLSRASQVDAEQAYDAYAKTFNEALASGVFDGADWLDEVNREYVLLELMLRSSVVFYNVDDVALLSDLEAHILEGVGAEPDEERQAFIQSKLRFLDKLFTFVEERKVSPEVASPLATELAFSAQVYLEDVSPQVAVRGYFESELAKHQLAIQFMNSSDYFASASFDDGLDAFSSKVEDLGELNDYLTDLRSGVFEDQEPVLDLDEAVYEVGVDLSTNGIQYSKIVSLQDIDFRLFEIEGARAAGESFQGNYDRATHIFYDVELGDIRFSAGIRLDDLIQVIERALTGDTEVRLIEDEISVGESGLSLKESVALEAVEDSFVEAGLKAKAFSFTIVDVDEGEFAFDGLLGIQLIPISGAFNLDTGKVSEVIWIYDDEVKVFPDVSLDTLEQGVLSTVKAFEASATDE